MVNDLLIKSVIFELANSLNQTTSFSEGEHLSASKLAYHHLLYIVETVSVDSVNLGVPRDPNMACGHDRLTKSRSYHTADDVYVGRSGIEAYVIVARGNESIHILVEIFDWQVWPDRQQYYYLDWDGNAVQYLPIH